PGKYQRREVTTGLRVGKTVEIRDGLFPGDLVVDVGRHELASLFQQEDHATKGGNVSSPEGDSRATIPSTATPGFRRRLEGEAKVIHALGRVELPTDR